MTANFIIEVVKSLFGINNTEEPAQQEAVEEGTEITIEREPAEGVEEPPVEEIDVDEPAPEESVDDVQKEEADLSDEAAVAEAEPEEAEAEETEVEATETAESETDEESVDDEPVDESDTPAPVGEINGIGPTYSNRLVSVGIETVAELGAADATTVAEAAEVSETRAEDWIEQANEF